MARRGPLAAGREHLAALMVRFKDVKHSVQTNDALVDVTWCELLLKRQVHVGVSIDGPEASGRTYDLVARFTGPLMVFMTAASVGFSTATAVMQR
ncbi:hypothetical protein [Streptomyces sp. NPDC000410]|uniref:hypothetical protein n=1 Tax=Streptomyces sp. NPDC000410 TaxID=3154254 RepID=UPI003321398D